MGEAAHRPRARLPPFPNDDRCEKLLFAAMEARTGTQEIGPCDIVTIADGGRPGLEAQIKKMFVPSGILQWARDQVYAKGADAIAQHKV